MNIEDKLNDLLDISDNVLVKKEKPEKMAVESNDDDLENDYKYARENIYNVIERGQDAIMELLEEARDSGNARLYEVLGQMLKTVGEQNQNLLNLHKQVKEVNKEVNTGPNNVTNALFVGSTLELQKMLSSKGGNGGHK